jgi:hypothetical protein
VGEKRQTERQRERTKVIKIRKGMKMDKNLKS